MQIELRPIDQIKPYPGNPRQNDEAVDAVAASLKEFGFRQPIVVDAEGIIIVGHTRYKAALKLGLKQVPVHVATDLTPAQVKAYRIADIGVGASAVGKGIPGIASPAGEGGSSGGLSLQEHGRQGSPPAGAGGVSLPTGGVEQKPSAPRRICGVKGDLHHRG